MKLTHYQYLKGMHTVDVHTIVDDFGREQSIGDHPIARISHHMFWNAFRFVNGISYDETKFRSIGIMVEEH